MCFHKWSPYGFDLAAATANSSPPNIQRKLTYICSKEQMFDENSAVVKLKCLPSTGACIGNVELQFENTQGVVSFVVFLYESKWLLKVILNDI